MEQIFQIFNILCTVTLAVVAAYIANKHNKLSRELSNDTMEKQLFTEFNGRYDKLNDVLQVVLDFDNVEIDRYMNSQNHEIFAGYKKSFIKFKINDYFNLCSEEYYWFTKKRIDKRIWNSWFRGMNDIYRKSVIIRDQWQEEIAEDGWKSFYMEKPTDLFGEI